MGMVDGETLTWSFCTIECALADAQPHYEVRGHYFRFRAFYSDKSRDCIRHRLVIKNEVLWTLVVGEWQ